MRPVVGMDIDGTIGLYHQHFITFASGYLGREISPEYDGRLPLHRHCGVSKERYRRIKLAYRKGSLKRSMPAIEWAAEMTREVSKLADIYYCTTRPYLAYDNIDEDTRWWLRHNGFRGKGVLWGEHKYRELAKLVGRERVATCMDDEEAMLEQAAKVFDIYPVMALRPHNSRMWHRQGGGHGWTYSAYDYESSMKQVKAAIERWKA